MIINFHEAPIRVVKNMHGGDGIIKEQLLFSPEHFRTGWDFAVKLEIPPQASIGLHKHGEDEEMYIVLKGTGEMTVNGADHKIKEGDMILNSPQYEHGLKNSSNQNMHLLVLQAS